MRDRIFDYLKSAGKPVSAHQILLDVLRIHSPSNEAAARVLEGILGDDCRFGFVDGLWLAKENAASGWETEAAFLFMESFERQKFLRGAIRFTGGMLCTFDTSNASPGNSRESALQASRLLANRPLIGWEEKDLRLWEFLLRLNGLPEWEGEFIPLCSLAARVIDLPARMTPGALASALHTTAPGECQPEAMARFLADCLPSLLVLVSPENRCNIRSLRAWISAGRRSVDFSRFDFGPESLKDIPDSPGAYIMRDRAGTVIYVGKSRNLKRRIRSYFAPKSLESPKAARIHGQLHSLEILPAANEVEALLLEMRLIRRLHPVINLQTEIHPGRAQRNWKNLLLIVVAESRKTALIYFLRDGLFTARRSVRLHRAPPLNIREKIRDVYFGRRGMKKSRNPREMEIVSRWLSWNRSRLNWIDVDAAGSYRAVVRQLRDYLDDPDELSKKVYYR